jgi:putative transposase
VVVVFISDTRQGCSTLRRYELTDEQWDLIEHLLPGREGDPGAHGEDNRLFVNAVIWVARTGAPWRDLPERFGEWNSVYQRFNRWSKGGVWARVFQACQLPDLEALLLDATIIRAHQHAAASQKKGRKRSGVRAAVTVPSCTSPAMPADNPWNSGSALVRSTT